MTDAEPPRDDLPRTKARLPFEQKRAGAGVPRGTIVIYGVLTAGFIGLALYMWLVEGHPLVGGYVAAPAIGAVWFGLRLFMMLGSRK